VIGFWQNHAHLLNLSQDVSEQPRIKSSAARGGPVNPSKMLERAEIGNHPDAPGLELGDDERRIRRAMRLKPSLAAKTTHRTLPTTMLGGAALFAGGVCLGWKAFGLLHD
jgi:hypothetical protein